MFVAYIHIVCVRVNNIDLHCVDNSLLRRAGKAKIKRCGIAVLSWKHLSLNCTIDLCVRFVLSSSP